MAATRTQDGTQEDHDDAGGLTAPVLLVALRRDRLDAAASRHVLLGVDAVEIGRGDGARRLAADGERLLRLGLPDDRVSTRHARLERRHGRWRVRDLGSRNGTFTDGERVDEAPLGDGAVLEIGRTFLVLRTDVALEPRAVADATEADLAPPWPGWATLHPGLAGRYRDVAALARSGLHVLVLGDTGAGKERVARGVHALSRPDGPFVAVNCATLAPELADSALFGHRRGAFTGAAEARTGLLRSARGGTLFLDEVGELPLPVQARLLRALETGEVLPLGADEPVAVDARIVAATHRPLADAAARGDFREDLYARLAQVTVTLPPLRERREDLGLMLRALLPAGATLTRGAAWALFRCGWPRNVRQLANALAVAARLADGAPIDARHLPDDTRPAAREADPPADEEAEARRASVEAALRDAGGNVTDAARRLSLSRTATHRWIRRLGLDPDRFRG